MQWMKIVNMPDLCKHHFTLNADTSAQYKSDQSALKDDELDNIYDLAGLYSM